MAGLPYYTDYTAIAINFQCINFMPADAGHYVAWFKFSTLLWKHVRAFAALLNVRRTQGEPPGRNIKFCLWNVVAMVLLLNSI